jgi:NTP pyrophosphatase (non-canonical NTP hydrolase)
MSEIQILADRIRAFADARDWQQFHTPKNLSMALAGEVGELLAEFQWLTPDQSMKESLTEVQVSNIELEIADVVIYLIRLADVLGISITDVVDRKISINELRF